MMSSTVSEQQRVQAAGGRHAGGRTLLRARLGAAGRFMGSFGRGVGVSEDVDRSGRWSRPVLETEPRLRGREGAVQVVVEAGETVFDVAVRHGVSAAGVLALNGLGWRAQLLEGQLLLVKPPTEARRAAPVADELHRHRVGEGESVSSVAERHGVSTAAVLLANGLSRGSAVRAGQQLVIPVPNPRRTGSAAVVLTGEMRDNAAAVVDAGRALGVPDDGIVVALAAAMQDSSLHNLPFGEGDAVGVFQQRPSLGWGEADRLLDPYRASLAFYGGAGSGVVAPATGLLDVGGWPFMSVGEAAHAVQRSSSPAAYAKWERSARGWLHELTRATP